MLKKLALCLLAPDANDASGGAASSTATTDDNATAESSTVDKGSDDGTSQTLSDVVEEAAAASLAREGTTKTSDSTIESDKGGEAATRTAKEESSADGKTTTKAGKLDDDGKELPPFHEHPRWKEMTTERNTFREKVTQYEKEWKPLVEHQKSIVSYCQENGITPQQFQETLEIAALINTNPREALKRIQPVLQNLMTFDESVLPPDLEERVAKEEIDVAVAREIAALRAKSKGDEFSSQVVKQKAEQTAHQQRLQALVDWEKSTMAKDPDMAPKKREEDADGKYEFVVNMFRGFVAQSPPKSPGELVRLLQRAYDSVNRTFTERLTPKKPLGKYIPASGSSGTSNTKEPETMEEAVFAAAARHGVV